MRGREGERGREREREGERGTEIEGSCWTTETCGRSDYHMTTIIRPELARDHYDCLADNPVAGTKVSLKQFSAHRELCVSLTTCKHFKEALISAPCPFPYPLTLC